jgi:hypothetical protein
VTDSIVFCAISRVFWTDKLISHLIIERNRCEKKQNLCDKSGKYLKWCDVTETDAELQMYWSADKILSSLFSQRP